MITSTAKYIALYLALIFSIAYSNTCFSQTRPNQYNPYVSNSDVWKLKEFSINLSEKPFRDISFQENIKKSLALRQKVIEERYYLAFIVSCSTFGILYSTSHLWLDKTYYPSLIFDENGMSTPHPKAGKRKPGNIGSYVLTGIGIAASIGVKIRLNRKTKKRDEQIAITKRQYDLLR